MSTAIAEDALLKPEVVARRLNICLKTLADWRTCNPQPLPFVRFGRCTIRYRREDVEEFLRANTENPAACHGI